MKKTVIAAALIASSNEIDLKRPRIDFDFHESDKEPVDTVQSVVQVPALSGMDLLDDDKIEPKKTLAETPKVDHTSEK